LQQQQVPAVQCCETAADRELRLDDQTMLEVSAPQIHGHRCKNTVTGKPVSRPFVGQSIQWTIMDLQEIRGNMKGNMVKNCELAAE